MLPDMLGERLELEEAIVVPAPVQGWAPWPIAWGAVIVGALVAGVLSLLIGLIGVAVGAHRVIAEPVTAWRTLGWAALVFSVCGAFFSCVAAGWVSGKLSGLREAQASTLHGTLAWLVTVPYLLVLALGFGASLGPWYVTGMSGIARPRCCSA